MERKETINWDNFFRQKLPEFVYTWEIQPYLLELNKKIKQDENSENQREYEKMADLLYTALFDKNSLNTVGDLLKKHLNNELDVKGLNSGLQELQVNGKLVKDNITNLDEAKKEQLAEIRSKKSNWPMLVKLSNLQDAVSTIQHDSNLYKITNPEERVKAFKESCNKEATDVFTDEKVKALDRMYQFIESYRKQFEDYKLDIINKAKAAGMMDDSNKEPKIKGIIDCLDAFDNTIRGIKGRISKYPNIPFDENAITQEIMKAMQTLQTNIKPHTILYGEEKGGLERKPSLHKGGSFKALVRKVSQGAFFANDEKGVAAVETIALIKNLTDGLDEAIRKTNDYNKKFKQL